MTDKKGQPERDDESEAMMSTYVRQLEESRKELTRERGLLHTMLDQAGDGVVAVDVQGRFLHWNRRATEILGMGPSDLPPENWPGHYGLYHSSNKLLNPDELPLVRAMRGETVHGQEIMVRNRGNPDGHWIAVYARPLNIGEHHADGAIALLVDVEENRQQQQLFQLQSSEQNKIGRLALIGQVVDTATHNLSQPLAAIANYTAAAIQLRSTGRLDDRRLDEILSHISRLAERGAQGLEALRALSRRGGRSYGKVDINAVVQAALSLLEESIKAREIKVEQQLTPELPEVTGNSAELQQAVAHLLLNAIEALAARRDEKRRLILTTKRTTDRDGRVRIEVADNGPGISTELYDSLFEPWFTTKPEALGLGLSVARGIAQTHQGDVIMETHEEEGLTRFTIELPATEEKDV